MNTNTLDEMCELIADCPHSTPEWTDSGFVVLRNQNIKNGRLDLSAPSFTDEEHFAQRIKRAEPRAGDIVFTREAPMGEVCMIPGGLRCCLGQRQVLLRPKVDVNGKYLLFALQSPAVQHEISWSEGTGSTVSNVRIPILKQLKIPRHPGAEDQIAEVLGGLTDKIELNRQINQTLEQIAQTIFKSWFVDFEPVKAKIEAKAAGRARQDGERSGNQKKPLDVASDVTWPEAVAGAIAKGDPERAAMCTISGKLEPELDQLSPEQYQQLAATAALFPDELVESELGLIPVGWGVSTVDAEFDLTMGQSPPGNTYNQSHEGLPFYQGRTDFGFRFPTNRVFCTAPTRFAEIGNSLVSVRAPVGDINMATERCCIGRGVAAAIHKSMSRSYTYYFMRSIEEVFSRFDAEGTVFGSISKKDFHNIQCIKPSTEIILEFERLAAPIDENISNNELSSRTLATLRDTLLPKLLSGELTVEKLPLESTA